MDALQLNILRHIGCYRLSLKEVLLRVFFEGNEQEYKRNITKLQNNGHIESVSFGRDGTPGYRYLKLTVKGAKAANVPKNRATPRNASAIYTDLGVLCFCHLGERDAQRIEIDLIEKALGRAFKAPVVVERPKEGGGDFKLYRVFSPDPNKKIESLPDQILGHLDEVKRLSLWVPISEEDITQKKSVPIQALLEAGMYCIAVLVHSDKLRAETEKLLQASNKQIPATICVETVPGPLNLQEVFRALPEKSPGPRAPSTPNRRKNEQLNQVRKKVPRKKRPSLNN